MRVLAGLFVGTLLGGIVFVFVLINLSLFHTVPSLMTFTFPEYVIAGVAACLVFGACMWRIALGSSAREESDRLFDILNDPGSSTD